MKEIAKLAGTGGRSVGYLDPAAFDGTVALPLMGGSTPVITTNPDGA